jgi:hypothetical protein
MLNLPNVTLVCVDDNYSRAKDAIKKCNDINFGAIKILSHIRELYIRIGANFNDGIEVENIDKLGSKEAYSNFIIKELHKYISTKYCLIVQHDGYVKNPEAWQNDFLNYDYIGATWWYKDGMNVGNGGFSLRSKKLLELTATMPCTKTHPEDDIICREMRPYLESKGVKFAPDSLANKFSFEGYYQPGTWDGQFGFHGARAFRRPPDPRKQGIIVNQFLGLGDILYLVPLIRHWMNLGHDIIWPIADEYFDIKQNFPDIQFVRKSDWHMNYEVQQEYNFAWKYGNYRVKPLRWNRSLRLEDAMTTKYTMNGVDDGMWRQLYWQRDYQKEQQLKDLLNIKGEYQLIFTEFGNVTDGGANSKIIGPMGGLQRIYVRKHPDYNLLDWSGIIENASVIHAVSSSCIYLFEILNLKAKEVHLYSRRLGQKDFDMVKPILSKQYIFHI